MLRQYHDSVPLLVGAVRELAAEVAAGAMAEGGKADSTNTSLQSTPTTPGSGQSVRYVHIHVHMCSIIDPIPMSVWE